MQGHLPTEHEPTISASMLASNDATPAPTTPLTHAIFLSTLIVPFALLPYIAITRRLRGLQSSATEIQHTTAAVQRELRATLLDNAVRKEEQARIRHAAEVTTAELKVLRERLERARAVQAAGETMVQELQRRIMQEREWRSRQAGVARELGSSLVDVAAFMHEVELRHGLLPKRRGIEKIRQLALKLQDTNELTKPDSTTNPTTTAAWRDDDKL